MDSSNNNEQINQAKQLFANLREDAERELMIMKMQQLMCSIESGLNFLRSSPCGQELLAKIVVKES